MEIKLNVNLLNVLNIYIHIYISMYIYIYVHIYIYVYICIYIHLKHFTAKSLMVKYTFLLIFSNTRAYFFCKTLHFQCIVNIFYVFYILVNILAIFRHIENFKGMLAILEYSELFHNCIQTHIPNPAIFTKIGEPSVTLGIQELGTLAILEYSET